MFRRFPSIKEATVIVDKKVDPKITDEQVNQYIKQLDFIRYLMSKIINFSQESDQIRYEFLSMFTNVLLKIIADSPVNKICVPVIKTLKYLNEQVYEQLERSAPKLDMENFDWMAESLFADVNIPYFKGLYLQNYKRDLAKFNALRFSAINSGLKVALNQLQEEGESLVAKLDQYVDQHDDRYDIALNKTLELQIDKIIRRFQWLTSSSLKNRLFGVDKSKRQIPFDLSGPKQAKSHKHRHG